MHIKQVIISGFRSFRSQSEIEPFSPKHNAIVGRNGSGKSNFFDAIQFVLATSRFSTLRHEERQQLLHEGAGANVMAAFVEVVFDNSDGRMAVDGDEVVLRRTIGLKKDEFFLNRKRVTKSEVTSLLESAGFSKSNPYYIVQQGKVNALCLSKDEERLQLLKEVAGTRVYEERREESNAIIVDTKMKREKIQEVISYIEERLEELEGEKEELSAYQKCDREKRALEYTIYDKELRKAREQIDSLESQRAEDAASVHELHERIRATEDDIEAQKKALVESEGDAERAARERRAAEDDRSRLVKARAKLEVDVKDVQDRVTDDALNQKKLEALAAGLDKDIDAAKAELGSVQPRYEAAKAAQVAADAKKSQTDLQMNELMAKQGRGQRFSSAKERDAFLSEQLAGLEQSIGQRRSGIQKLEQRVEDSAAQRDMVGRLMASKEAEMKKRAAAMAQASKDVAEKTEKRHALNEERKARWQANQEVDDEVRKWQADLQTHERDYRASMPKHIAQGLEAVEKIAKAEKVKGYYGPLVDNFTLTQGKFRVAVEVAASNALFNVVVEDDEVASKLIERLRRDNLGRVTFMPLRQLNIQELSYPQSNDVHPLIKVAVKYEAKMEKAMQQVFGKKLIARDFDTARQFARECNMDAITMEGDEVNRKGALEGGFHDERRSKLGAYFGMTEAKAKLDAARAKKGDAEARSLELDTAIANLMGAIQREEALRANLRAQNEQAAGELKQAAEDLSRVEERHQKDATESLPAMRAELAALQDQAKSFRDELGTALQQTLTAEERARLAKLLSAAEGLATKAAAAAAEVDEVSVERLRLQSLLKDNLLKQRAELREKLSSAGGDALGGDADVGERAVTLDLKSKELGQVARETELCAERIKALDKSAAGCKEAVRVAKRALDDLKAQESVDRDALSEVDKNTEKQLNKRKMLVEKRDENLRKIQQLGSLPAAELEHFAKDSVKDLYRSLQKVNQELTKYSHVNKKALDQYVNFSEQREALLERKTEMDKGAEAIEELILALDRQKDEAILRTFKGASKHFSEVFKELVPLGSGQLIMRTSADRGGAEGRAEDEDSAGGGSSQASALSLSASALSASGGLRVIDFEGVQVRVSFTPGGEVFLMSQLSGGQKALVALSIIFAIQRCDPAPFYLFDELDQALDSTYRGAVAAMIQRQANAAQPTQFITTTFRPELVGVASKCYGISLQNKNSNIHALSKKDALGFVADLMNEEEAVGQAGAAPLPRLARKRAPEPSLAEADEDDGGGDDDDDEEDAPKPKGNVKKPSKAPPAEEEDDEEEDDDDEEEEEEEESAPVARKRKGRK